MKYSKLPRIYLKDKLTKSDIIEFDKENLNYLTKVLRMRDGFDIRVFNEIFGEFHAKINIQGKRVYAELIDNIRMPSEKDIKIYVFAPVIKLNKFEEICDSVTQLGADYIIPCVFDRSQKIDFKIERINKIIFEATRQCERLDFPVYRKPVQLNDIQFDDFNHIFFANEHENQDNRFSRDLKGNVAFFIGPEGGLTNEEIEFLSSKAAKSISLGDNVLRSEVAAIALMSKILL